MGQGIVDTQAYEETINQLRVSTSKIFEECSQMSSAARTCIDNMQEDNAAINKANKLQGYLKGISDAVQELDKVTAAMQKVLERTYELIRKSQSE